MINTNYKSILMQEDSTIEKTTPDPESTVRRNSLPSLVVKEATILEARNESIKNVRDTVQSRLPEKKKRNSIGKI